MCSLFVVGWGVGTARHQQLLCALGASHESRLSGNEWSAPLVLFGEMMSQLRGNIATVMTRWCVPNRILLHKTANILNKVL